MLKIDWIINVAYCRAGECFLSKKKMGQAGYVWKKEADREAETSGICDKIMVGLDFCCVKNMDCGT